MKRSQWGVAIVAVLAMPLALAVPSEAGIGTTDRVGAAAGTTSDQGHDHGKEWTQRGDAQTTLRQPSGAAGKRSGGYVPPQGPQFNLPRSGPKTQFRIENQVLGAIRHAKEGSIIRMSMFSFDRFPVADALIAAKRRGVKVQVLVNDHEFTGAQAKMRRFLGSVRKGGGSYYRQCTHGCRSHGGILHSKFVLFSHTGRAANTVMVGSVNMKLNGAKNQYNDLLTMNNAKRTYQNLTAYFLELSRDRPAKPAYWKYNIGKNVEVRASPWHGAARNDPDMKMLAPVRCFGAATRSGRTQVMINMHAWYGGRGIYIAKRVRALYAAGCDVRVQYGYGGRAVRQILGSSTKRGRVPTRSNGLDTDYDGEIDLYSHMKLILIRGNYAGARNRKVVITGSVNFQGPAGQISGDELIYRAYSSKFFSAYKHNFDWMWTQRTRAVVPTGSSRVSARMQVQIPEPTFPREELID